ncbi:MAG TPA: hypothetical protein VGK84_13235 [Candidatus Tumulicola sp.]
MKTTIFWDVLSHWCLVSVPAARAVSDLGEVEIVYAPVADGAPLGFTNELEAWCYRRGTLAYDRIFHADWCEGPETRTWFANAAALVIGRIIGDQIRAAELLALAAMEERALMGRPDVAFAQAALVANVPASEIARRSEDPAIAEHLSAGNHRMRELGLDERPSFLLENANGDRAIFKGMWQKEAIVAAARALLADEEAYRVAGPPPGTARHSADGT